LIVIDTDVLIEIFDKNSEIGHKILNKIKDEYICTTSINLHEILYGFKKIGKRIPNKIKYLKILDYKKDEADLSAKLEVELEKIGNPIGRFDCMIAAICLNNNAPILTLNINHFK